eukprot:scaffold7900_cov363-Prasinococcus_capsulatus_cf.AAC.4
MWDGGAWARAEHAEPPSQPPCSRDYCSRAWLPSTRSTLCKCIGAVQITAFLTILSSSQSGLC